MILSLYLIIGLIIFVVGVINQPKDRIIHPNILFIAGITLMLFWPVILIFVRGER